MHVQNAQGSNPPNPAVAAVASLQKLSEVREKQRLKLKESLSWLHRVAVGDRTAMMRRGAVSDRISRAASVLADANRERLACTDGGRQSLGAVIDSP